MTINEDKFQYVAKYGGIVLGLAAILNVFLVLKYREVHRDRGEAERQFQQAALQEQAYEGVLQAVVQLAPKDPPVAELLRKYQVIGGAPAGTASQTQGTKP
jgi:hypothetical protein